MDSLATTLGLNWPAVEDRLAIMSLTAADRDRLRESAPAIEANADRFIDDLYLRLTQSPGIAPWFTRPETVSRLRPQQRAYLTELFAAPIDWSYVLRRLQIGVAHHRVRLTPRWYIATCSHFLCDHIPTLLASSPTPAEGIERLIVLTKTILFDASIILDAYGMSLEQSMRTGEASARLAAEGHPGASAGSAAGRTPGPGQKPPLTRMPLTSDDCEERQRFLGIDATTLQTLRSLETPFRRALPGLLQDFYNVFRRWPGTADLLSDEVIERLLQQVSSYWIELAQAQFDRPYAASRTRIGIVHEQIGVSPQVYLVGLARQIAGLLRAATAGHPDPALAGSSVLRAVFYDISFILDAYMDARATSVLRSEGYAAQLLACLTVGVAVLDANLRVRSANPALLQLLGVEAGIVRHLHARDLIPDRRVDTILERAAADRGRRESLMMEFGGRRLRVTAVRMDSPAEETNTASLALLVDDVTDLVTMAPEVDQSERRLFETVATVDTVLWEAEAGSWIMTMISTPVLALTGLRDVHFLGRPGAWLDRIPEPDRERLVEQCGRLGLNRRCAVVHRMTHADGSTRWVRTHVIRTGTSAQGSMLRGVSMDVSSSFLAEQQRLEAVGRLAGRLAHEFNGLLTTLSGSLGLLMEGAEEEDRIEIKAANDAIARGASLTRRLQAFAQGSPLRLTPAVLNRVIHSLATSLRQAAGAGVEVALETQEELWPCQIDPDQFGGALMNLVVNARESMPFGGQVRIATRNIRARDILPTAGTTVFEDHVEVTVADTGVGMKSETRSRSIEPFFTTKNGGAGLGLSVVHGFVRQSRGHLVIESSLNQGTTIRLRFPRLAPQQPANPATSESGAPKGRVVVVEDDRSIAAVLQRMLVRRGHAVRVAHSIEDARGLIASEPPELVICDVVFEGEAQGSVFGRELGLQYPELPLVYTSGYTKASLHLEEGDLFLAKPFTLEDLDRILKQVFVCAV